MSVAAQEMNRKQREPENQMRSSPNSMHWTPPWRTSLGWGNVNLLSASEKHWSERRSLVCEGQNRRHILAHINLAVLAISCAIQCCNYFAISCPSFTSIPSIWYFYTRSNTLCKSALSLLSAIREYNPLCYLFAVCTIVLVCQRYDCVDQLVRNLPTTANTLPVLVVVLRNGQMSGCRTGRHDNWVKVLPQYTRYQSVEAKPWDSSWNQEKQRTAQACQTAILHKSSLHSFGCWIAVVLVLTALDEAWGGVRASGRQDHHIN